jgi:hypothetical protein
MRRSCAAACLVLLGALLPGPEPSVATTTTPDHLRLSATGARSDGARQVVEILRDGAGMVAFRTGLRANDPTGTATWAVPTGDAVALDGSWWTLARPIQPTPAPAPDTALLQELAVDIVDATTGDADGDGTDEIVVVFRRPFRETVVSGLLPEVAGTDSAGRSLHLGLYTADMTQEWVAGTVFRPVSAVAACDGALALGFASGVDTTDQVATGATLWGGFGFTTLPGLPDLPGPGDPACADVDGDGRTEPIVVNRTPEGRTSR